MFQKMFLSLCVRALFLQLIVCAQNEKCAHLQFDNFTDNTISIHENDDIYLKFGVNDSACSQTNYNYMISVKTLRNNGFTEEDGRLELQKDRCDVTTKGNVECTKLDDKAELYRKINRSHIGIQWKLTWLENGRFKDVIKRMDLNVLYSPNVTSLTVDGHEVSGVHLLSENQEAFVNCSFDQGNPPAIFHLVNQIGQEVASASAEKHFIYAVRVHRCSHPWPTLHCEGDGSKQNRSVSFLVRCPLEFADGPPKIDDLGKLTQIKFHIKSHTRKLLGCTIISNILPQNSSQVISCILTGIPPDLALTVHLENEEDFLEGNWTLIVTNEISSANTSFLLYYSGPSGKCAGLVFGRMPTRWMSPKSVVTPKTTRPEPKFREPPVVPERVCYTSLIYVIKDLAKLPAMWVILRKYEDVLDLGLVSDSSGELQVKVSLSQETDLQTRVYVLQMPAAHLSKEAQSKTSVHWYH